MTTPARAVMGMSIPTRGDSILLAVALMLALGAATQNYFVDYDKWRYDLLQAIDDCGTYLFIVSPFYAGLACWSAARESARMNEIGLGLPNRGLVWRTGCGAVMALALTIHVVIVLVMCMTAIGSGALPKFQLVPLLVQFLSIAAFIGLGAAVGGVMKSRIAAPLLFLVVLLLNTVFASFGFRRLSDVGSGSADFIDLRLSMSYELPKVAVFAAVVLFCLPFRRRVLRVAVAYILSAILLIGGLLGLVGLNGDPLEYSPAARACGQVSSVEVCAPTTLGDYQSSFAAAVTRVDALLAESGASLPGRVDVVSRAADSSSLPVYSGRRIAIPVTADALHSSKLLLSEVRSGYAYGLACPRVSAKSLDQACG